MLPLCEVRRVGRSLPAIIPGSRTALGAILLRIRDGRSTVFLVPKACPPWWVALGNAPPLEAKLPLTAKAFPSTIHYAGWLWE